MKRSTRRQITVLAALTFAVASAGYAQVQQVNLGGGMDANPGVGTGGSNRAVPGYVPVNQNAIFYGNVSGLGYFHGQVNTANPYVFQGSLPSSALNSFARQSAGNATGVASVYYLPSSMVSTAGGSLYSSPTGGGFDSAQIPLTSISPLATQQQIQSLDPNGTSINGMAYNRANAAITSIEPRAPVALLSMPIFGLRVPALKPQGEGMLDSTGTLVNSNTADNQDQTTDDDTVPHKMSRSDPVSVTETGRVDPRIVGVPQSVKDASISPKEKKEVDDRIGDTFRTLLDDLNKAEAEAAAKDAGTETTTTQPAGTDLKGSNLMGDTIDPLTGMPRKMSPFIKPNATTTRPSHGGAFDDEPSEPSLTPKRLEDTPLNTLRVGASVKPVTTFVPVRTNGRQTSVDVLMAQAEKALKGGKYLEAAESYQTALAKQPDNALALVGRAHAELGAGMYQSAAYDLKFVFTRNPQMVSVRYDMDTFIPKARQEALMNDLAGLAGSKDSSNAASFLLCYLYYETGRSQQLTTELQKWGGRDNHDSWQAVLKKAWTTETPGGRPLMTPVSPSSKGASGSIPAAGSAVPGELAGGGPEGRVIPPLGEVTAHPESSAGGGGGDSGAGAEATAKIAPLKLTEFLDLATLQDIQDSLAMVAQVKASILDTAGVPLTQTTVSERFSNRSAAIAAARRQKGDGNLDQPFSAPIIVNDIKLGTIVMEPAKAVPIKSSQVTKLAKKLGVPVEHVRAIIDAMNEEGMGQRTASVQFLYLLASALSRLCSQEMQLRQRIQELSALFNISTMLSGTRGLQQILDRITRGVAEALHVKSCSLRLLEEHREELVIKSVWGLSEKYLQKGPVTVAMSTIDRAALSGHSVYIHDMATDERVIYPHEAQQEGIVSSLVVGMLYKERPIGVLRVYTAVVHEFSDFERKLLESIASQAAVAIENARLQEEAVEKDRLERQVQIAAEVQRRMMPAKPPKAAGLDVAALYVPCFELGGDFYDFIPLGDHSVGITVADVVGKGLPASLLMASVRAAMRAQADNVYDLDEIVSRVNKSMSLDMRSNEFITLWYGVLDYQQKQLTYCSAGHEPAILIRGGQLRELAIGGMVIGVDPDQKYDKEVVQLQKGDVLWIYTDGVPDAMNYSGEKFGKQRMRECLLKHLGESAEQICRQMLWETRRFVGLNRRTDDTTMVVVKVTE